MFHVAYLRVILTGASEVADRTYAENQIVENQHHVVDDRQADEKEWSGWGWLVFRRPKHHHRYRVSFNTINYYCRQLKQTVGGKLHIVGLLLADFETELLIFSQPDSSHTWIKFRCRFGLIKNYDRYGTVKCNCLNEQNKCGVVRPEELPSFHCKRRMTAEFGTRLWHMKRNAEALSEKK